MNILTEIDRQAQSDGALQQDARDGQMLLTLLEATWFEQGRVAAQMGLTPTGFWNEYQRAGYSMMTTAYQTFASARTATA